MGEDHVHPLRGTMWRHRGISHFPGVAVPGVIFFQDEEGADKKILKQILRKI
jgi:hypothetical protein